MPVFADADYGSKPAVRMSVSGGVVMWGVTCVLWLSRTQRYVTLSTTDVEHADILKGVSFSRQVCFFFVARGRHVVHLGVRG